MENLFIGKNIDTLFYPLVPIFKQYIRTHLSREVQNIEISSYLVECDQEISVIAKNKGKIVYNSNFKAVDFIKLYQFVMNNPAIKHNAFSNEILNALNENAKSIHDLMQSADIKFSRLLKVFNAPALGLLNGFKNSTYTLALDYVNPELYDSEKMATSDPIITFGFKFNQKDDKCFFTSLDMEKVFTMISEMKTF